MLGRCNNLLAEMARNGISRSDIGTLCGISSSSTDNKLSGRNDFLLQECLKIHDTYFPTLEWKYLFARN